MHLTFICLANNSIGTGHLSRCINLCRSSIDLGINCDLVIFTDTLCNSHLGKLPFPYTIASLKDLIESNFFFPYSTCIIADIVFTNFLKKHNALKIFSNLNFKHFLNTFLILFLFLQLNAVT